MRLTTILETRNHQLIAPKCFRCSGTDGICFFLIAFDPKSFQTNNVRFLYSLLPSTLHCRLCALLKKLLRREFILSFREPTVSGSSHRLALRGDQRGHDQHYPGHRTPTNNINLSTYYFVSPKKSFCFCFDEPMKGCDMKNTATAELDPYKYRTPNHTNSWKP